MGFQNLKPPTPLSDTTKGNFKVFLAGSIEQGKAEDWQATVTDLLCASDVASKLTVYNPRREEWDSTWEQRASSPKFREQVEWEMDALDSSDVIVFYFAAGTMSPISLLELGLHAHRGEKLVVYCPDGYWRKGNVEIVCERHNAELVSSVEDLAAGVVKRLSGASTADTDTEPPAGKRPRS